MMEKYQVTYIFVDNPEKVFVSHIRQSSPEKAALEAFTNQQEDSGYRKHQIGDACIVKTPKQKCFNYIYDISDKTNPDKQLPKLRLVEDHELKVWREFYSSNPRRVLGIDAAQSIIGESNVKTNENEQSGKMGSRKNFPGS